MYVFCETCEWEGTSDQLRRVRGFHLCPKCGQMHELSNEDGERLDPRTLEPESR